MESSLLLLLLSSLLASSLFLLSFAAADLVENHNVTEPAEADAIKAIYNAWNISDWKINHDNSNDPCNTNGTNGSPWRHLKCTCFSGSTPGSCNIVSLDLSEQDIRAEIVPALFNLTSLTSLNLSACNLNGAIDGIQKLTNLTFLDLSKNLLSGSVSHVSSLNQLQHLDLSINLFNGSVPNFQKLASLTYLNFGSNNFSSLQVIGSLTLLKELYFDSSGASGNLDSIGSFPALEYLHAFDNPLTGNLSNFHIENSINLTDLRIYGTDINGSIPTSFRGLTSLTILIIGDLHDDGPISSAASSSSSQSGFDFSIFSNMRNLQTLSLRNCSLKGNILNIPRLPKLMYLDLSFNSLIAGITPLVVETKTNFQDKFPALTQLYLGGGNNNISGDLSELVTTNLVDLDVSYNSITGVRSKYPTVHINYLGTPIQPGSSSNSKVSQILDSIKNKSPGNNIRKFTSTDTIAIKCGGNVEKSKSISYYNNDTNPLASTDLNFDTKNLWVLSNIASYPQNKNTYDYTTSTLDFISRTDSTEYIPLYQTARRSQGELSYYVVDLPNADNYTVELHFAEIVIGDLTSWKGLGKRYFNIKVLENETRDFNIMDRADGSPDTAVILTYHNVSVVNGLIDIHFVWTGRGTCCIPENGTYGPLISAIRIYQGDTPPTPPPSPPPSSSKVKTRRDKAGILVGFLSLGIAGVMIILSVLFLWWEWIQLGKEFKQ